MKKLILSIVILIATSVNLTAQVSSKIAYKSTRNEICEVKKDEKCIKTIEITIFLIEESIITQLTPKGIDTYIISDKKSEEGKETYYVKNNLGTKYLIVYDINKKEIHLFLEDTGKTYIIIYS